MEATAVRDLMEAYDSIYHQKNRTDTEVQFIVNSLLDEGYDLSDYTWDDMYAAYDHLQKEGYTFEVENWVNLLLDEGYDLSNYTWDDLYEIYENQLNIDEGWNDIVNTARGVVNNPVGTLKNLGASALNATKNAILDGRPMTWGRVGRSIAGRTAGLLTPGVNTPFNLTRRRGLAFAGLASLPLAAGSPEEGAVSLGMINPRLAPIGAMQSRLGPSDPRRLGPGGSEMCPATLNGKPTQVPCGSIVGSQRSGTTPTPTPTTRPTVRPVINTRGEMQDVTVGKRYPAPGGYYTYDQSGRRTFTKT